MVSISLTFIEDTIEKFIIELQFWISAVPNILNIEILYIFLYWFGLYKVLWGAL